MISPVSSFINVLFYVTFPYTENELSYPVINFYLHYVIWDVYIVSLK